jgi:hypothetical protein
MKLTRSVLFLALAFGMASLAHADFPVRQTGNPSYPPALAYNSTNHQYLAVWSELTWNGSAYFPALMGQRLGEDGSLLGSAFQIFFIGSNPTVAYNSSANEYLVGFNPGTGYAGQRVSAAGNLVGNLTGLMDAVSNGRLLYNSLTNEYLFLGALLVENPTGSGYYNIQLRSRKIGADGQPLNSPVSVDDRPHGYQPGEPSFGIAFAPIQSSETPNGRYVVVIGHGVALKMLDSDGAPMDIVHDPDHPELTYQYIPFKTGRGLGGEFGVDVAYGTSSAYSMNGPAFLIVWADNNNSFENQTVWSGIYGGFVDAMKTDYRTNEVVSDHSFPLTFEWDHWARDQEAVTWRPKVAFNYSSQKFYVVWREMPGTDPRDDTHVNHIRATDVFERIPSDPSNNVIISATNAAADPQYPALASSTTSEHALVVWQDYRDKGSTSANIYASVQKVADPVPPPPPPPPTTTWVVTNTNDAGSGSLRQAILNANARAGIDTIAFNIPGSGIHSIQPLSSLPTVSDPVLIDGYTQPGSSANTNAFINGLNTTLSIELNGVNAGSAANGLHITAGGSTVRGLVINRFDSCGIKLDGPGGNRIVGNFIGMDPTGMTPLNNRVYGVGIHNCPSNFVGGLAPGASNLITGNGQVQGSSTSGAALWIMGDLSTGTTIQGNFIGVTATGRAKLALPLNGIWNIGDNTTIGGTEPGAGNVISGNTVGLFLWEDGSTVQGNYVGTDVTGTASLGNRRGIQVFGGNNLVGGLTAAAGNIISGNTNEGIFIGTDGRTGNIIEGNRIGTQADGIHPLSNGSQGMSVYGAENCATIGGTADGAGNTIAFNGREGIRIPLNIGGVSMFHNSIFGNGRLGIDLAGGTEDANGVTANDPGDADTGPNGLQNYPVLTSVEGGDYLSIDGTLNSTPNTTCKLEFFSTPSQETGGSRQGKTFLTSTEVATDGSGNASFSFTYGTPMGSGNVITATATDPNGNTSEFSDPVLIQFTSSDFTVTNTNDDGPGSLRQAILAANALPGKNTISFNIPGDGPHMISPNSALPSITDPVIIDGYTQPGSSANINLLDKPSNAAIQVVLFGGSMNPIPQYADGLTIYAGNSRVRGLEIVQFRRHGVYISDKGYSVIDGNILGPNQYGAGVEISNSQGNLVGGTQPESRNIICGNYSYGVEIQDPGAISNQVQGNYIGLEAAGASVHRNKFGGVLIANASSNTIGGTVPGTVNVIVGGDDGVDIRDTATKNRIVGNLIGTNPSGTDTLHNRKVGVSIRANGNFVGGTSQGARNIIAGWWNGGLSITGDSNTVQNNFIGMDITGTKALGNSGGALIWGSRNQIGGHTLAAANVISGNRAYGLKIYGGGTPETASDGNRVQGNRVGTQGDGFTPLGNDGPGVIVQGLSINSMIGDSLPEGGNIIAGNTADGIYLVPDPTYSTDPKGIWISRNSIYGNGGLGINLAGGIEDSKGCTQNDTWDADTGPNDLQNSPVITYTQSGENLHLTGYLDAMVDTVYSLDVYASPSHEPQPPGEGQTWLGAITVRTNANGHGDFDAFIAGPLGVGRVITATATDRNGSTSEFSAPFVVVTGIAGNPAALLPHETALLQNYPNPFNPRTVVRSQLSVVSDVRIVIYDLLGREVSVLVDERRSAGTYRDEFNGSGLASGVYIYRMSAGNFVATKTMLLVK